MAVCLAVAVTGAGSTVRADPPPPPVPPPVSDERLVLSADGSSLTGGSGGGGASAVWLDRLVSGAVVGGGAEYQQISNSHWTNGTVSGSIGLGQPKPLTNLYGEAHEGAGDIGARAFHYSLLVAGVFQTLTPSLSAQLEERRIDVDTSHGNLPKFGLAYQATPRLLVSASYAYSLGGNLGTRLTTLRLDYHGARLGGLGGVAWGPVAPAVVNLLGQVLVPSPTLKDGFLGLTAPLGRTEWLLLGDYADLDGFKRTTITLTCTVHMGTAARVP